MERDFDIKVFSLGGEPRSEISSVVIPRSGRISYVTKAGLAAKEIKAFQPDLVHAHYAVGFGWWMLRCKIRPRVVSVWGADVIDFPNSFLKRAFIRRVLRGADHITATSQLLKKVTEQLLPETVDKMSVIPFGVTVPKTITPPPPTGPIRLCFVKGHRKKYGPEILLRALAKARQTVPDLSLTLAGEGDLTSDLHDLTAKLGLTEIVRFVGFIDNDKVYDLIRDHHFMVMPSTMESESFGVAVLEAGACGRAVVASNVGGVPEVLADGITGLLVPPGNVDVLAETIVRLASDKELCRRMGEEGYLFVKKAYDWEISLNTMSELYQRLFDAK